MTEPIHKTLLTKGFIQEDQYQKLDAIVTGKIVSVFYELRTILYLGVLLFTTGVGILIYQNIGEIGHLVSIAALTLLTGMCFSYALTKGPVYSNEPVVGPTPYFDYIVLLGSLLFISVLGYVQVQYEILTDRMGLLTLVTAIFFFLIAYRFDHAGVLSLAITALASFWSISISPKKWYHGDFLSNVHVYNTAIIFGIVVGGIALFLEWKAIKKHFTFTYINFCTLIFFIGAIAGLFDTTAWGFYLVLIYMGCAFAYWMARRKRSFLFLLYAFVTAYIGTTYLLALTVLMNAPELWFFYSFASCAGFIVFIVRYRNYFTRTE